MRVLKKGGIYDGSEQGGHLLDFSSTWAKTSRYSAYSSSRGKKFI